MTTSNSAVAEQHNIWTPPMPLSKLDYQVIRTVRTREVTLISGNSGAGKTLLMTGFESLDLKRYYLLNKYYERLWGVEFKYYPAPLQIWSNYYIDCPYIAEQDGAVFKDADKKVTLATKDLNVEKLYIFDEEMREGKVYIDELDLIADRQDWQSGGSKLLVAILRQIRKRHLSLTGSIQSIQWLNPRFYFQIDVMIGCRDSSVTAWGQENGLEPGEMTFLYAKDRSGAITGYSYDETGDVYESMYHGQGIKPFYDTDQEFNPFDNMVSYKIKRKKKEIDPFAEDDDGEAPLSQDEINDAIAVEIAEYVLKGQDKMPLSTIQEALNDKGVRVARKQLIEHLELVHNVPSYMRMGYPWIRLGNATNLEAFLE